MTARDLDLVLGGAAIVLAGVLSRLAEPAHAIVLLALAVTAFVTWLGEDRIEELWRAYCAEPPPRSRVCRSSTLPRGPHRPPRADRRAAALPRARVVSTR